MLVLCHSFHLNYGHWLFNCLPVLLPWRALLRQGRLAVLVRPLTAWQRRTLDLLDVPASAVVEALDPSVRCSEVIIPGVTFLDAQRGDVASKTIPEPEAMVVEAIRMLQAGVCAADGPEYIYVSRRGIVSFRQLCNEDEVEAAMVRLGFTIMRPQELSFDEQVAIFARARVIVGPHGAGLTNAAFAARGCLVVDICTDSWATGWMVRLTRLFGHYYFPLEFPSDAARSQPVFLVNAVVAHSHVYTVQIDTLVAAIESVMQKLNIESPAAVK